MSLIDNIDHSNLPAHVAIIMDGNGRWAQARGLGRGEGHKEGIASIRKVVEAASKLTIPYLTLYAFSTENWNRPSEEVSGLMDLMVYAITEETDDLKKNNVRIRCIGDMSRLPNHARTTLERCIRDTENGTGLTLNIALSYSSKWELTEAARKIAGDVAKGVLQQSDINEGTLSNYLTTKGMPDPDLLVRTGGEQRISNFLLWQCAYAELYFTDIFWPDFGEEDFYMAILDFQGRERRFGQTSEQVDSHPVADRTER